MKKLVLFTLWGMIFMAFGMVLYRWLDEPGYMVIGDKNLVQIELPRDINFAGEHVPLDDFYVREAWERDLLILADSPHQSILYLKRSGKYFPFIEEELRRRNLPQDLKYIAVAESALRASPTSSAGARGIWQFMPATARQQGLIVDNSVDERMHFEKATRAALDYLEFLYEKFENWSLAAASYNAGHNRILGHLVDQQVVNYHDLFMNAETSRYLFRILAIKEIMEHPEKYNIALEDADFFDWPSYSTRTVNEEIEDLAAWAKSQGSNLKIVKELNPWILGSSLPQGRWEIKVAPE